MKNKIIKHIYRNGICYTFRNSCEFTFKNHTVKVPQFVILFYDYDSKTITLIFRKLIKKGYKKYNPDSKIIRVFKHHYYIEWSEMVTHNTANYIFSILQDINAHGFKN